MTLGDFFQLMSNNPTVVCFLFIATPLTAFLASIFGKEEGNTTPWKELYSILVYAACIPGIFAITLSVYMFFFDRQPILETNIFTQILPIISMVLTLWLIRKNVDFKDIPGFEKLGGLVMILTAIILTMWVLEKTHIYAITFIPFHYFLLLLVGVLVAVRLGWKQMFKIKA
ncbi:MAG: hypothetical protein V3V14_02875 [Saprospiraceae bacterium]